MQHIIRLSVHPSIHPLIRAHRHKKEGGGGRKESEKRVVGGGIKEDTVLD